MDLRKDPLAQLCLSLAVVAHKIIDVSVERDGDGRGRSGGTRIESSPETSGVLWNLGGGRSILQHWT